MMTRRRRAQRPRLRRAGARGRDRPAAERRRLARARPARRHRQARRPVHAGRLLLPDDHPAARAWPLYEKFLRNAAGLGRLDEHGDAREPLRRRAPPRRGAGDRRRRRPGVEAAARAAPRARAGSVARSSTSGPLAAGREQASRSSRPARAIGIYEGGLVPVDAGNVLYRYRAERIVVATGAIEQPLVFPGNDLVGVMLPGGVRGSSTTGRSSRASAPSSSPWTSAGLDAADALRAAGVDVAERRRPPRERSREIVARGREGRAPLGRRSTGARSPATSLVMSGRPPARLLAARAGGREGRVRPRRAASSSRPTSRTESRRSAPSPARASRRAVPAAAYNGAREGQVLRLRLRGRRPTRI